MFGETGSYDPSSSFRQWKGFLADQPIQPLSLSKSSEALTHPGQPDLSLSRQWDIGSIWFGAKGLQVIQSPNDFRLSLLPSAGLNISKDEVIQPHGLDLARTRHIKLGTFSAHSVRFSAFVFFPNAAKDMASSTRNALSLERQKDLYDHVIIPAAFEAVFNPFRQELPRAYLSRTNIKSSEVVLRRDQPRLPSRLISSEYGQSQTKDRTILETWEIVQDAKTKSAMGEGVRASSGGGSAWRESNLAFS
jgi:hypothetical protein